MSAWFQSSTKESAVAATPMQLRQCLPRGSAFTLSSKPTTSSRSCHSLQMPSCPAILRPTLISSARHPSCPLLAMEATQIHQRTASLRVALTDLTLVTKSNARRVRKSKLFKLKRLNERLWRMGRLPPRWLFTRICSSMGRAFTNTERERLSEGMRFSSSDGVRLT